MIRQDSVATGRLRAPFLALLAVCAAMPALSDQAQAQDRLELALPVDCVLGDTCYIQQYVDRDPGPGRRDFACGTLANDGHVGTDFAVATDAEMERGIRVLAAAPGTVRATRDGMPDIRQFSRDAPEIVGRECGNAVAIDHGGGWETRYCHLRQGSVSVRSGEEVDTGTPLGMIGTSGLASFPHVHVTVEKSGAVVDPFHPDDSADCGPPRTPLWTTDIAYDPGGPVALGFAQSIPDYDAAQAGLPANAITTESQAIVLWALIANVEDGDHLEVTIMGPDGLFYQQSARLDRTQAMRMQAMGRRTPGVAAGEWTGTARHTRDGRVIGTRRLTVRVP